MNNQPCILITGAAKRIGRILALCFAGAGWHVQAHYHHSRKDAECLLGEIVEMKKGSASLLQAPLNSAEDAEKLFALAKQDNAVPNVIINNAALFQPEKPVTAESRAAHLGTNFEAPQRLVQLQHAQGGGAAINILDGFYSPLLPAFPSYAESKKLLEEWTATAQPSFQPALSLYGLKIGPTMRNERESEEHFEVMVRACPRGRATPLPLICKTALRMASREEESVIVDIS